MTSTFRHYTRLASILALLVTAAGCSSPTDADDSNGNSNNGSGSNSSVTNCTTQTNACMTALIDGAPFTSITSASGIGSYAGGLLAAGGGDSNYALAFALFINGT